MDYWLQISITVEQPAVQRITEAMDGLGAVAVSRQHAGGSARFDTALSDFQGWSTENVSGLFPPDADQKTICNYLHDASGGHTGIHCQILADRNWEQIGRDQFKPFNVEGDLWICPSWCQPPVPNAVNIIIDPGLAFGTGTHPTTALCLRQLTNIDLTEHTVLDWGCGSGILAVAALKLGALRATATDIDPKALSITRENGQNNGIGDQLTVKTPEQIVSPMIFDIVIANILARTLIELAPRLNSLLAADGMV
ncbi:MAG TPA: 50S ribosomal protein L11 methyltransferase, partial [Gammaproteobacteria bacterium]|nr:50S ribosomal protein L11 methyltransferase [Gammaproteobacteria bacterium]